MKRFSKENVGKEQNFRRYRKKVLTLAKKIDEPFITETLEGELYCSSGYLAIDASGNPYPIAIDEFGKIYEEVDEKPGD